MTDQPNASSIIQALVAARAGRTDAELLEELTRVPALADEGDAVWETHVYWEASGYLYVALADLVAQRQLRPGVRLLLERACLGDPGEIMRGLRHSLEAAFNPDWAALADVCMEMAAAERDGTRQWAMQQLMILDDPRARPVFERALGDALEDVRGSAETGLKRLDRLMS